MMNQKAQPGIRRVAIILTTCTTADCPLEATCVSRDEDYKREVICGHYQGSITNCNGSRVICGYQGA